MKKTLAKLLVGPFKWCFLECLEELPLNERKEIIRSMFIHLNEK